MEASTMVKGGHTRLIGLQLNKKHLSMTLKVVLKVKINFY